MSSKYPLIVVLAELASQLRALRADLNLGWAPRDQNEAADAITNSDLAEFDPSLRGEIDLEKVAWLVLPQYMRVADDISNDVRAGRGTTAPAMEELPRMLPQPAQRRKAKYKGRGGRAEPASGPPARTPKAAKRAPLRERDPW